jgi:hypothetical protein
MWTVVNRHNVLEGAGLAHVRPQSTPDANNGAVKLPDASVTGD